MPTYLSPGVFVEEVPAGTQPIEGVGTSTGAFVGLAERGALNEPRLITNYGQFVNEFGRFITDGYLAYSVFSFFAEGGTRCYVVRVDGPAFALATSGTLNGGTDPALRIDAASPGTWGNRISYTITAPTNESTTTHFQLTIQYQDFIGGRENIVTEVFDDVSASTVEGVVNSASLYVRVASLGNFRPDDITTAANLSGGADDRANADFIGLPASSSNEASGIYAFDPVDEINIVAIPELNQASDRNSVVAALNYCEQRGDCFFVADTPSDLTPSEAKDFKQATGTFTGGNALNSSYGAVYYPWVSVNDPLAVAPKLVPPSGLVAGSYANTDATRGVFKAPAGTVDGFLNSAVGIERQVTRGEQDILNPLGVNVIRTFPASGIVIWGARTLSNIAEFRYVPVRRLLLFLEESLDEGSQFVVFEPNDPTLWGKVRRTLTAFLTRVWRDGALFGNSPEEAFFVKVDEENNPPAVRDAGQLIIEIGVAPVKPAEFVIIRIQQQSQISGG